jgi:hypothetical protein
VNRVTIPEAAQLLGVTQNAVRQRIHRHSIKHEKGEDGKTYVFLDSTVTRTEGVNDLSRDSLLIKSMQDQIDTLKQELAIRNEDLRRKDHILAALTERIPAIEAPREEASEPRESDLTASEGQGKGVVPPDAQNGSERLSWWRRLFQ